MMAYIHRILIASLIILTPALSWGVNPHDEYYAADLFTAIKEAKTRPHHYDYSRAKRYNRSTTQSLDIPRLFNKEMGSASIETVEASSTLPLNMLLDDQNKLPEITEDGVTTNRFIPLNTVAPIANNPNVHAENVKTNVIAR